MHTRAPMTAGLFALVLLCSLTGCSGTLYSVYDPSPQYGSGARHEGIQVLGTRLVDRALVRDRIVHPRTGEITHHAYTRDPDRFCVPVRFTKQIAVSDPSTSFFVVYEPGWLETNKFSVALENGRLQSINTESTPAAKTAVEALQGVVDVVEDVFVVGDDGRDERIRCSHGETPAP